MTETAEQIKAKILELSKEYYRQVRPDKRRADYIPASGKKLGEEELFRHSDIRL